MMPKLKVEQANVSDLIPYAGNAKLHDDAQVAQIAASIDQFGFNDPIGVWTRPDGQMEIVEGHGRVLAAKELGIERVPIVRLDHLDDDARRAYVHVHNQTTLTSGFDENDLVVDLSTIPGFDWSDFGFNDVDIVDFGTDFSLSDDDEPQFKSVSLHLTGEQYEALMGILASVDRDNCVMQGGNETGDKVCEVARRWAAR